MTLTDKAMEYAHTHMQGVRIGWLDEPATVCDAVEAVTLCSDPYAAARMVGVVAQDQKLTAMLHQLIDRE